MSNNCTVSKVLKRYNVLEDKLQYVDKAIKQKANSFFWVELRFRALNRDIKNLATQYNGKIQSILKSSINLQQLSLKDSKMKEDNIDYLEDCYRISDIDTFIPQQVTHNKHESKDLDQANRELKISTEYLRYSMTTEQKDIDIDLNLESIETMNDIENEINIKAVDMVDSEMTLTEKTVIPTVFLSEKMYIPMRNDKEVKLNRLKWLILSVVGVMSILGITFSVVSQLTWEMFLVVHLPFTASLVCGIFSVTLLIVFLYQVIFELRKSDNLL